MISKLHIHVRAYRKSKDLGSRSQINKKGIKKMSERKKGEGKKKGEKKEKKKTKP